MQSNNLLTSGTVYRNLSVPQLIEHIILNKEGLLSFDGPVIMNTVPYTGRSPNDKYTIEEDTTKDKIWWGKVNVARDEQTYKKLFDKVMAHLKDKPKYVMDCYAGADPKYRLPVRIITEQAWQNLFATNLFLRIKDRKELDTFDPQFTVISATGFEADPALDNVKSKAFVFINFKERVVLIGNTSYGGEIKKSMFTVMNYLLPEKGVLPMHCSANIGPNGDSAIFFGLSGTGKTSLSADPSRTLIGDDEHGWSDNGIFNFEGGCYAKVIRLSPTAEPDIYQCAHNFGTILENVVYDEHKRTIDFDDNTITENTRAAYPIYQLSNVKEDGLGDHPKNIIMLTADAFGVLPPISRLTPAQAMYNFILGYTAKVAGTERGIDEPQATFSTCFGAPFMPRHPSVYAQMLGEKIKQYNATCWLVNTGWTGGPYGVGHRIEIKYTRAMVHAALEGKLDKVEMKKHPVFNYEYPVECEGVPSELLDPKATWKDKEAYDKKAKDLAADFINNFANYEDFASDEIKQAKPKA